jgi:hypothetical protein
MTTQDFWKKSLKNHPGLNVAGIEWTPALRTAADGGWVIVWQANDPVYGIIATRVMPAGVRVKYFPAKEVAGRKPVYGGSTTVLPIREENLTTENYIEWLYALFDRVAIEVGEALGGTAGAVAGEQGGGERDDAEEKYAGAPRALGSPPGAQLSEPEDQSVTLRDKVQAALKGDDVEAIITAVKLAHKARRLQPDDLLDVYLRAKQLRSNKLMNMARSLRLESEVHTRVRRALSEAGRRRQLR